MNNIYNDFINKESGKPRLRDRVFVFVLGLVLALIFILILQLQSLSQRIRVASATGVPDSIVERLDSLTADNQQIRAGYAKHSQMLSQMSQELEVYANREPGKTPSVDSQTLRHEFAYLMNCHMGVYGAAGLDADPNCKPAHLSY